MTEKITSLILDYPRHICLITLLITVAFVPLVLDLKVENKRGAFSLPDDDPVAQTVEKYDEIFGYSESLYILIESDSIFDSALLEALHEFIAKVRNIDGVEDVRSVFDARTVIWHSGLSGYRPRLVKLFDSNGRNTIPMDRISDMLSSEPLYNRTIVSPELTHQALIIDLKSLQTEGVHSAKERAEITNTIMGLLKPISDRNRLTLAGLPVLDKALQTKLHQSLKVFVPLSILFTVILMTVIFQSWRPVLLVTALASITLIWALGIMSATGASISLSTVMIIPLIMTISAAYSMHYLDFYLRHHRNGFERHEVIRQMLSVVFKPSILCSLTTIVGFLALCTSQLWGISNLGLYMAIGVACSMYTANIFLPALMYQSLRKAGHKALILNRISAVARSTGAISFRSFRAISLVLAATVLVAAVGASRLKVETNQYEYFGDRDPIRLAYDRIDEKVTGTLPVDIVISVPRDSLSERAATLIRFRDSLEAIPKFGGCTSLFDFLQLMENAKSETVSRTRYPFDLKQNWFKRSFWAQLHESGDLKDYFHYTGDEYLIRLAGRLPVQGSLGLTGVLDRIDAVASEVLSGLRTDLSGPVPLFVRMQQYVVSTQILSLSISLLAIVVLFAIISGSWKSGLAAIAANSLTVIFVLGIMGFREIPLDVTTVMIAAVAIAIAADDTIHFLYRYRIETARKAAPSVAVENVLGVVGAPVIGTSILVTSGLAVLALSDFVPIRNFGLLTGFLIVLALIADLVFVPALIRMMAGKETASNRVKVG